MKFLVDATNHLEVKLQASAAGEAWLPERTPITPSFSRDQISHRLRFMATKKELSKNKNAKLRTHAVKTRPVKRSANDC